MTRKNGAILWEGPSSLDGAPLIVVATGFADQSSNRKTGSMVQTWILRSDIEPHAALATGLDRSICGDCPHRSVASGGAGSCYVTVFQAPLSIFRAYQRGIYPRVTDPRAIRSLMAGRLVRLGSYGDPAAAPDWIWAACITSARGWTGYTHQWRRAPELRSICMASVDHIGEALEARVAGWRTFRVAPKGDSQRIQREARCPASEEAGRRATCAECPIACNGTKGASPLSVVIQAHGATAGRISTKEIE